MENQLKLSLKWYPVGAHLHPSLLPHPWFCVICKVSGQGTKKGPNWENPGCHPQIQHINLFLFSLMGCPPLAYIMGARYMRQGSDVMLAIGYGYSLFDFDIDYYYGYWFWLLLMAIGSGYPLFDFATNYCYGYWLQIIIMAIDFFWLLVILRFNFQSQGFQRLNIRVYILRF